MQSKMQQGFDKRKQYLSNLCFWLCSLGTFFCWFSFPSTNFHWQNQYGKKALLFMTTGKYRQKIRSAVCSLCYQHTPSQLSSYKVPKPTLTRRSTTRLERSRLTCFVSHFVSPSTLPSLLLPLTSLKRTYVFQVQADSQAVEGGP